MRGLARYLRWEIFERQAYRRSGLELKPTDTVLDIGGNIGLFVLWAAPQVPRGRVVTVEPNPRALECLEINLRQNGLTNVRVVRAAASGSDGTMQLTFRPGYEAFAFDRSLGTPWFYTSAAPARLFRWAAERLIGQPALPPSEVTEVTKLSLPRIMSEQQISWVDFLKLDCEGSEFEILRSLAPDDWSRINAIAMEFHLGPGRRLDELVAILKRNGYAVEVNRRMLDRIARRVAKFGTLWAWRRLGRWKE